MSNLTPTADSIEHFPSSPAPEDSWPGTRVVNGGKGYVNAPLGQLHFRDIGPKGSRSPMLLLHQSPQSLVEFGTVQNSLANLGVRSIAVDTPGYGMSDHPDGLPTIGGLADNLLALLDALRLPTVVAAGHHTGACIATALAARHPARVAGVVLHGCPLYSTEEAERARGKTLWKCSPVHDGAHMSQIFRWPGSGDAHDLYNRTWMSVGLFQQSRDLGHWAVARYAMADDLLKIAAPGMIITEVDDVTHEMDQRARELRPDFVYREITLPGASAIMTDPDGWATLAASLTGHLDGSIR